MRRSATHGFIHYPRWLKPAATVKASLCEAELAVTSRSKRDALREDGIQEAQRTATVTGRSRKKRPHY